MNRGSVLPGSSYNLPKTSNRLEASSEAAGTPLVTASSGEYAESVAEDWTPEDDSPPDSPPR